MSIMFKIWLFENMNWLYQWVFGILTVDSLRDLNPKLNNKK
jgi:hypothetical protein